MNIPKIATKLFNRTKPYPYTEESDKIILEALCASRDKIVKSDVVTEKSQARLKDLQREISIVSDRLKWYD